MRRILSFKNDLIEVIKEPYHVLQTQTEEQEGMSLYRL